jgi:hypothetical protein
MPDDTIVFSFAKNGGFLTLALSDKKIAVDNPVMHVIQTVRGIEV